MTPLDDALIAFNRQTDSMENIRLYMMHIHEHMQQLMHHVDTLGTITMNIHQRLEKLESDKMNG